MPEPRPVSDTAERGRVLDPAASFIVQAPAGSGKTALLVQRLLVLLARVERPEEIVAITFTRKAASEMRARLLGALARAADATPPEPEHERAVWEHARSVLARDAAQGWRLLENPARLRIQTIDAFCSALTRQAPVRSGLGGQLPTTEDATAHYGQAARDALAGLEAGGPAADAAARLLVHLDNRQAQAEALLRAMLARRDQWLRHVADAGDPVALRAALEADLAAEVAEALGHVHTALDAALAAQGGPGELFRLAGHAAGHAARLDPAASIAGLAGLRALPPAEPDALPHWQALADLLLTGQGTWRRSLTKNNGFPTDKASGDPADLKAAKADMQALLERLAAVPGLDARLGTVRLLPPARYSDAQWALLEALLALLPRAAERLRTVFAAAGEVDFVETALATLRALAGAGSAALVEPPLRHLLVDEFQDTSATQFDLLERLTAEWRPGDGRTLFLVGDPMQSIYRFREAEVGLFLRARRQGLGALAPEPATLRVNFRSGQGVVDWVNGCFPAVLAAEEDIAAGAVPYSAAEPRHGADAGTAVNVHPLFDAQDGADLRQAEAHTVVALVRDALAARPEGTVAVLVRARSHLRAIAPALAEAGLSFQAVQIEPLGQRPVVLDLLSLTRALLLPGDRVAWLAVLRAPWCGLALADLLALAGPYPRRAVWDLLTDEAVLAGLSGDGRARVHRVTAALAPCFAERNRRPARRWVEGAWHALGGPACVDAAERRNAEAFLALLEAQQGEGGTIDTDALETALEGLYAPPDPLADVRVQLMTMHQAKGLEFDTVILPALERGTRAGDPPLLRWFERPREAGGSGLLLAPISETGAETDPVYRYLAALEKEKEGHEVGRLLYVAATRAKHALHLVGTVRLKEGEVRPPPNGTLLQRLWSIVEEAFLDRAPAALQPEAAPDSAPAADAPAPAIRRVPTDFAPLPPPADFAWVAPAEPEADPEEVRDLPFRASDMARHVGTVVHRALLQIARQGLDPWQPERIAARVPIFRAALARLGVRPGELEDGAERVRAALAAAVTDARGRWLLGAQAEARSEYPVTLVRGGVPRAMKIDRTFVAGGTRWIVDYKTGTHGGGDREGFLDREQERYRGQLEGYATVMARLHPGHPIRLGLYFPLLGAWREWPAP